MRPSTKVRSELATTVRCRPDADHAIARLRREYKASRLAEHLKKQIDSFPPFTPAQICELQAILSTADAVDNVNGIGEPDLDASGLPHCGEQ